MKTSTLKIPIGCKSAPVASRVQKTKVSSGCPAFEDRRESSRVWSGVQAGIAQSPRMVAQKKCVEKAFCFSSSCVAPLQRKPKNEASDETFAFDSEGALKTWEYEAKDKMLYVKLFQYGKIKTKNVIAWKLVLFSAEGGQLGTVDIQYNNKTQEVNPESMAIASRFQREGLGSILTMHVPMVMASTHIAGVLSKKGSAPTGMISMSSAIMVQAAVKRLVLERAGEDTTAGDAFSAATVLVSKIEDTTDSKKYRMSSFPNLWGRMVYLMQNHGVSFDVCGKKVNHENVAEMMHFVAAKFEGWRKGRPDFGVKCFFPLE